MATLLDDRFTVGIWPLPGTLKRANLLAGLVTPGVGSFELRPLPFDNIGEAIKNGDISSIDDYVSPYSSFTLTVTAIPTDPDEVITNVSFEPLPPLPAATPFKAILEEPNPVSLPSRTDAKEPQVIEPSPLWDPPIVAEQYIQTLSGVTTATMVGYYTERAWYDREWILRYPDCLAKISSLGVQYVRFEDVPQGKPIDPDVLFRKAPILPSSITPTTWYPLTKADAQLFDHPEMPKYLQTCSGVVSYKGTEIRKLRFSYIVYITSVIAPGAPIVTPVYCFMTVQYNSKLTEQRLEYALNIKKTPLPLLPVKNA